MADIISSAKDLAVTLKAARQRLKRRQEDAAAAANISRQHLSDIENGKATHLELPTLLRLLTSYGMALMIAPQSARPTLNDILRERDAEQDA